MRQKKGLKRKFIIPCLACTLSFSMLSLGNMEAVASEVICQGGQTEEKQLIKLEPSTAVCRFVEQGEILYKLAKENLNGTEQYIETGIEVPQDKMTDFLYSMKVYFLGEIPNLSYLPDSNRPEMSKILLEREGLQTCIEQHDIALEKLQEIANQTQSMTTAEEKIAYYSSYLYNSYAYDYTKNNTTVYEFLTNKSGICHSYTTAFSWLCKLSGIPTLYVKGALDGGFHGWNKVQNQEGEWMPIDVTNLHLSPNYSYLESEYYSSHFEEKEYYLFQ